MESYLGRHSGSWEGEQGSAVTVEAWNDFWMDI